MGRKSVSKTRYDNANIREKLAVRAMVYFQNNGVKGVTMSKMAKDLALSKTTIYNHYPTKESLLQAALTYKLDTISEYETVLENLTLNYTERYRKAMLYFCVQLFEVSEKLMTQIRDYYPDLWRQVMMFQRRTFKNLVSYYEVGLDIGVFKPDSHPVLLALDDQQFFEMLGTTNLLQENEITVLEAFNHHYKTKFQGVLDPHYELKRQGL